MKQFIRNATASAILMAGFGVCTGQPPAPPDRPPPPPERRDAPPEGDRKGPPEGDRKGPPPERGDRKGPPEGDRKGPPPERGDRKGPPEGDRKGPPPERGDRKGPPEGDRKGPPPGVGPWRGGDERPDAAGGPGGRGGRGGPGVPGGPPNREPLDAELAEALRNSPDIIEAEAKLRSAEAALQVARLRTIQRITSLRADLRTAKANLELAKSNLDAAHKSQRANAISAAELTKARIEVERAEAEVVRAQEALNSAIGRMPPGIPGGMMGIPGRPAQAALVPFTGDGPVTEERGPRSGAPGMPPSPSLFRGPSNMVAGETAERVRKWLLTPVELKADTKQLSLEDTIAALTETANAEAVPFRIINAAKTPTVSLPKGKLSIGEYLLSIEDEHPTVQFVVREYGLLVTTKDRVPEGAVRIRDVMRSAAGGRPSLQAPPAPPAPGAGPARPMPLVAPPSPGRGPRPPMPKDDE